MKKIVFSFIIVSLLIACESDSPMNTEVEEEMSSNDQSDDQASNDDSQEEDTMDDSLDMQREAFYTFLSQNSSKVWKIDSAMLENSNGTFDVSLSSNINDDEFTFIVTDDSGTNEFGGELTWKSRKGTNFEFDNNIPFENDSYLSPETFEFSINQDAQIEGSKLQFNLDENSIINGKIHSNDSDSFISITLTEKTENDYKDIPGILNFESYEVFPNIKSINNATGFKSSYTTNSIYLSYRNSPSSFNATRKIFKYSLVGQTLDSTEISLPNPEFTYSRFYIRKDRLIVFGSAHISELDLLLIEEPNTVTTGLENNLSGADLAAKDSDIYVIGGDLSNNAVPEPPLVVRKYDDLTFELKTEKMIGDTRTLFGGEIVDNTLYISGGQNPELEWYNDILIYNTEDESISSIELPKSIALSSSVRYENLIFISGRTIINDNIEIFFGALDTRDNSFQEIPVTIDGKLSSETFVNGLTILNNELYIAITDRRNENPFIEVQKVDL